MSERVTGCWNVQTSCTITARRVDQNSSKKNLLLIVYLRNSNKSRARRRRPARHTKHTCNHDGPSWSMPCHAMPWSNGPCMVREPWREPGLAGQCARGRAVGACAHACVSLGSRSQFFKTNAGPTAATKPIPGAGLAAGGREQGGLAGSLLLWPRTDWAHHAGIRGRAC